MPRLSHILLLIFLLGRAAEGEEVSVFRLTQDDPGAMTLGAKIGTLATGTRTLAALIQDYEKTSWVSEPFYGPVTRFGFRDESGQWFVVHFEFIEGHRLVGEGLRFAIAPMRNVSGSKGRFRGEPYNGSSVTEESILKQLRVLAVQK